MPKTSQMNNTEDKKPILNDKTAQWLFGAFISVVAFIGVQMINQLADVNVKVNSIESSLNVQASEYLYYKEDMKTIKETLSTGVTKEDLDLSLTPIIKQLNANTEELNKRSAFIESTNNKILRLELKLEAQRK